jgi:hypothetical protein
MVVSGKCVEQIASGIKVSRCLDQKEGFAEKNGLLAFAFC